MPTIYNKVVLDGTTLIDISDTTATASDVAQGKYFYTANGIKTLGTSSGGGSGTGQTATGTVTGDGTNVLEIPCNFAPDLIYVYGDMSGDVANRGMVSLMIIKDVAIYASHDTSASTTDEYATVLHGITGYNESNTSILHAIYSNNTLTINTVSNSTAAKWRSGQVYNYELSTIGTGGGSTPTLITKSITTNGTYTASNDSADGYSSVTVNVSSSGITPTGTKQISITQNGTTTEDVTNYASAQITVNVSGGTPSATAHTIYFEFSDETDTTITAYYDSSFISDAITATTPTTYGQKTVILAQLDGVTWYSYDPTESWETIWDDNISWSKEDNGDYPYCWITSLGNTPITVGSIWRITYNNIEYRCTARSVSFGGLSYNMFGNPVWSGGPDDGSGVPFVFTDYTNYGAWTGGLNVPNVDSNYYFKIERLITS